MGPGVIFNINWNEGGFSKRALRALVKLNKKEKEKLKKDLKLKFKRKTCFLRVSIDDG